MENKTVSGGITMNYEDAIKKPFTDLGKLVIGIIVSLIPIVNLVARGFALECSGVGKNRSSKTMPEWKGIWEYFVKGLVSAVIAFFYMLPAILVFTAMLIYALGSMAALGMMMPNLGMSAVSGQYLSGWIAQNFAQMMPALMAMVPLLLLGIVLLLVGVYAYPIGVLNYLSTKSFAKAFDMKIVKVNLLNGNYFMAWQISGLVAVGVSIVLSFIPVLGSAAASFISGVITWDLYGQAFRKK